MGENDSSGEALESLVGGRSSPPALNYCGSKCTPGIDSKTSRSPLRHAPLNLGERGHSVENPPNVWLRYKYCFGLSNYFLPPQQNLEL